MSEVLFINPNYLKQNTQLNGAIDEAYIAPAIIIAQDTYVQVYLGTNLYDKLKADITAGTIAGAYKTLMDNYVRKVTSWWTMVELLPNLHVQIDNGGLVIRQGENTSAVSSSDLSREVERCRKNAMFYTRQMYRYLCNNNADFPEYNTSNPTDIVPEAATYTQNGYTITGRVPFERWREFYG